LDRPAPATPSRYNAASAAFSPSCHRHPVHVARFDLLIDGYNLMHVAGFAREQYGPRGLQQQRERFLDWLWKRIPPKLRPRTIVVFDAGEADGTYVQQGTHNDLRLLYSPRGLEADDVIEELIELHSAPKQLQVVSSDHRLHKAARKRKATCLDSEAFVSLMFRLAREARARREAEEELSKPTGALPEETAEWLRVFSEVDELLTGGDPLKAPSKPTPPPTNVDATTPSSSGATSRPESYIADAELAFWQERLQDLLPPRKQSRP
jgi:predicted RNA-binding protein with PIN domain